MDPTARISPHGAASYSAPTVGGLHAPAPKRPKPRVARPTGERLNATCAACYNAFGARCEGEVGESCTRCSKLGLPCVLKGLALVDGMPVPEGKLVYACLHCGEETDSVDAARRHAAQQVRCRPPTKLQTAHQAPTCAALECTKLL